MGDLHLSFVNYCCLCRNTASKQQSPAGTSCRAWRRAARALGAPPASGEILRWRRLRRQVGKPRRGGYNALFQQADTSQAMAAPSWTAIDLINEAGRDCTRPILGHRMWPETVTITARLPAARASASLGGTSDWYREANYSINHRRWRNPSAIFAVQNRRVIRAQ